MSDDRQREQDRRDEEEGRAPWKLIALLILVIALAVFFFQNGDDVAVDFLWFNGEWPLWAVIGISVLIGVALDRLLTWQWRRARRRKVNS